MSKQKYPITTTTDGTTTGKASKSGRKNYSTAKSEASAQRRRDEAAQRQADYDSLNIAEKLALISSRQKHGKDKGESKREVSKLTKKLHLEQAQNVTSKVQKTPVPVLPAPVEAKTKRKAKSPKASKVAKE